jgi:hypothetical protein
MNLVTYKFIDLLYYIIFIFIIFIDLHTNIILLT